MTLQAVHNFYLSFYISSRKSWLIFRFLDMSFYLSSLLVQVTNLAAKISPLSLFLHFITRPNLPLKRNCKIILMEATNDQQSMSDLSLKASSFLLVELTESSERFIVVPIVMDIIINRSAAQKRISVHLRTEYHAP